MELDKLQTIIQSHDKANKNYIETGIEILELANEAYDLYLTQPINQKIRLLKRVLSNFSLKDGNVSYTYKKPFDILAEGLSCTISLVSKF